MRRKHRVQTGTIRYEFDDVFVKMPNAVELRLATIEPIEIRWTWGEGDPDVGCCAGIQDWEVEASTIQVLATDEDDREIRLEVDITRADPVWKQVVAALDDHIQQKCADDHQSEVDYGYGG